MVKVSIITPCFNAANTIGATIASVRAQRFDDWEHIVVDDGSSDGSAAVLEQSAAEEPRLRPIVLDRNQGPARARNAGIQASTGRFVAFLDADDLWHPEKLVRQIAFMEEQNSPFSFTAYERQSMQGHVLGQVRAPQRLNRSALLHRNPIGCLTAIYDAEALGRLEMPDIRQQEDWALWLRVLSHTPWALGLDEVLAVHRRRPGSHSANKLRAMRYTWRLYREIERLPLPVAAWYLGQYTARQLWLRGWQSLRSTRFSQ